jgi:hypothetical protein
MGTSPSTVRFPEPQAVLRGGLLASEASIQRLSGHGQKARCFAPAGDRDTSCMKAPLVKRRFVFAFRAFGEIRRREILLA